MKQMMNTAITIMNFRSHFMWYFIYELLDYPAKDEKFMAVDYVLFS